MAPTSVKALALVLLAGLPMIPAEDSSVWWSPDLGISASEQAKAALNQPVLLSEGAPLTLHKAGEEKTVGTCSEYLNAKTEGFGATNNFDYSQEGRFIQRCYALRVLENVEPARLNFLGDEGWTRAMAEALPPLLYSGFPNPQADAAQNAQNHGEKWTAFDPQLQFDSTTSTKLTAHDGETQFQLDIVARGDFNRDGIEDFALAGFANARRGTFRYFQFLILSRLKPGAPLLVLTEAAPPFDLKSGVVTDGITK